MDITTKLSLLIQKHSIPFFTYANVLSLYSSIKFCSLLLGIFILFSCYCEWGFFSVKFSKCLLLIDRKTIDICLFSFVIGQIKNMFNFTSNQGNANENNDIPFFAL